MKLKKTKVDEATSNTQPLLVANKAKSGLAEISRADFEASVERKVDFVLPEDSKAATNAAKLGQAFVEANKFSKVTAQLRKVVEHIGSAGDEELVNEEESSKKSLLGSLDLKGLLTPSKKEKSRSEKKPKTKGAAKADA